MAGNFEILGINALDIPITDDLKCMRPVNTDAEIIVKDILLDIVDTAVRKSEESQQKITDEKNYTENRDPNTSDLIDLTRNYKQEFRTILQNLKCQSHKTKPTISNTNLEDQIKKVIDEIKCLETSVRLNFDDGRGETEEIEENNFKPVEYKSEITDFLTCTEIPQHPKEFSEDEDNENEEIVLQIINLEEDSDVRFNNFPSDEDLEDVNLNSEDTDRPESSKSGRSSRMEDYEYLDNSLSNKEDKITKTDDKRKKNIGKRLWNFITKNTKSASTSTQSFKKKENVQ